jgi:8-oxo-dGTP pyrophosphatase MutT (NUDIX family)
MILFRVKGAPWNQAHTLIHNSNSINGLDTLHSNIEYLLIQRRDSLGFVDLVRGKYKLQDVDYFRKQLLGTTLEERERLLTVPFETIWNELWGVNVEQQGQTYKSEKEFSRVKMETLRRGYTHELTGDTVKLETLIQSTPLIWSTPEWGFPKGRRDFKESDFQCAVREVKEETGFLERDFCPIRNLHPIQESFFGSNNIHYCHKYFLAFVQSQEPAKMDMANPHMSREVGNIGWFSLEAALTSIRPENVEKREILLKASSLLRNFCPLRLA